MNNLLKILIIQIAFMIGAGFLFAQSLPNKKAAKLKKHDLSFTVSVDSILYRMKQKRKVVFIDVRSPEEYAKVHIPGSMNIPIYSIETKPFLKTAHLVLVNNGYDYDQLAKECEKLTKSGFNVSILWGGLTAWKEKGMQFEGDIFAVEQLDRISPRDVYLEKNYKGYLIIAVAIETSNNFNRLLPIAHHLKILNEKTINMAVGSESQNPYSLVLILNKDGNGYDAYENVVKKSGLSNVFYLTGGLSGYKRFLQNVALSNAPQQNRIKTVNKCSP